MEWRDDHEVQRYSYRAGVDVEYAFNDHWILASGIQFSDRGYGTDDTGIIAMAAPSLGRSTDLGQQLNVNATGLLFNRATGTYDAMLTIRNVSSASVAGPISVAVLSLPQAVVLANATAVADEGASLITLAASRSIRAGATLSVPLRFVNRSSAAFRYDVRLVRLLDSIPALSILLGPDANGNGVRDDLEPLLTTRYGSSPQLQSAATKVLGSLREALGSTGSVRNCIQFGRPAVQVA